ncbi:MAG: hypothetical protein NWF10_04820 [Candidatus Bathyarchaeota archaeon]|nr:hypothetical protein [Candidatus Bathyarchaeota archaeon]
MIFPVDLGELSVLYAVIALILLVTSELLSPYHHRINLLVSRKRLRVVAIVFSVLFIVTVSLRIFNMIDL